MAKRPSRTVSPAPSSETAPTQDPGYREPASSSPDLKLSAPEPQSPHQKEPTDPKTGYSQNLMGKLRAAAATLRDLDDAALCGLAAETLIPMLGGLSDEIPLVGTLGDKIRKHLISSEEAPLGRVTHKVVRVFLGELMSGRVPNDRRIAYTAVQHATALVILEGDLWA